MTVLIEKIAVYGLPTGYTARPASMADLEIVVDLLNACSLSYLGLAEITADDLRKEWEMPDFVLEQSTLLVFEPGGRLVGYTDVWDTSNPPVYPYVWGRVHPEFEGQGIGSALLAWTEKRALEALARVPQEYRFALRGNSPSTYVASRRLLEEAGYRPIRHFWRMVINLDEATPAPEWPEGVTLRPFDRERDALALYRATEEAFQDHWGHIEQPEEKGFRDWTHWVLEHDDFDPSLLFVAVEGDEIAGFATCRPQLGEDPDMGWVSQLGVRRGWRRKGLALALLLHTFREFRERGRKRVGLGVDASSLTGATRLYERAGMRVEREYITYEKEVRAGKELATQSVE